MATASQATAFRDTRLPLSFNQCFTCCFKGRDRLLDVAISVGTTLAVLLVTVLAAFAIWRRRQRMAAHSSMRTLLGTTLKQWTLADVRRATGNFDKTKNSMRTLLGTTLKPWTLADVRRATGDFDETKKIGRGGFGTVYSGELEDIPVAVKRLKQDGKQGWEEFEKELSIIGSIHNRNLVRLLGYCVEGGECLLVYELMVNGSLEDALFAKDGRAPSEWRQCLQILLGTSQALAYLHESCSEKIIHRDIKPANILLDADYVAKVSDFGMARCTPIADTHVSTNLKGTIGYLAPEYTATLQLSEKSDVYSFGMVILVVISNRRPWSVRGDRVIGLSTEAFLLAREGRELELVAPRFADSFDVDEARRFISVALLCIQPSWQSRPSMGSVVQMLNGNMDIPPVNLKSIDVYCSREGFSLDPDTSFSG